MKSIAAALIALAASVPAYAAEAQLIIYYNDRPPHHYTDDQGVPQGPAISKVSAALKAAAIPYDLRTLPAKQQLVKLQENQERACMMAWVDIPGRDSKGKFSEVIYKDEPEGYERRLWCTKAVPDEEMQRLNTALRKQI